MSDRPTPETDANTAPHLYNFVRAKFARKLERERDEAREALRTLAEHGEIEIQKLIKERDEAREALRQILAETNGRNPSNNHPLYGGDSLL